jgi:prevent-host-death family protein
VPRGLQRNQGQASPPRGEEFSPYPSTTLLLPLSDRGSSLDHFSPNEIALDGYGNLYNLYELYKLYKLCKTDCPVLKEFLFEQCEGAPLVMTMTATEARDRLPETLNQVAYGGERVCITRHGKVVGVLISPQDFALLQALEDRYWAETAQEALAEMKGTGETPVPWEEVKAKLGL